MLEIEKYRQLNESHKRLFIYDFSQSGLTAEINNMVLAMVYALEHKLQFTLNTDTWSVERSWDHFFVPFCPEKTLTFGYQMSSSKLKILRIGNRIARPLFRLRKKACQSFSKTLFKDDVWGVMRHRKFVDQNFSFPELGLEGDMQSVLAELTQMIFKFSPRITEAIRLDFHEQQFLEESVGFHIRRGDKVGDFNYPDPEAELIATEHYMNLLSQFFPQVKKVFVATDDYRAVTELEKLYPSYQFMTFTPPASVGYDQRVFARLGKKCKETEVIDMLKTLCGLRLAQGFIGSYSSNIGRFMVLLRGNQSCYTADVDFDILY